MAKNEGKERRVERDFGFEGGRSDYNFQLMRKHRWWLIPLLLLLLIPLFYLGRLIWFYLDDRTTNLVQYQETTCGTATESGGEEGIVKAVNMGQTSGTFLFEYDTYSAWDKIKIYNGKQPKGKPIFKYMGGTEGFVSEQIQFNSNDGYISIVVKGLESGTAWDFTVNCPQ